MFAVLARLVHELVDDAGRSGSASGTFGPALAIRSAGSSVTKWEKVRARKFQPSGLLCRGKLRPYALLSFCQAPALRSKPREVLKKSPPDVDASDGI